MLGLEMPQNPSSPICATFAPGLLEEHGHTDAVLHHHLSIHVHYTHDVEWTSTGISVSV